MSREGVVQSLRIPVAHGELEARLERPEETVRGAAVLGHPHPEHGGTMHSKPVYYLARALRTAGLSTLRFNFRGVGESTGEYDGGIGELDDFRQCLDFLEQKYPDRPIVTGGFSFGSSIALRVSWENDRVAVMVGLGVPVREVRKPLPTGGDKPLLIVQGSRDKFGSAGDLRDWLGDRSNVRLEILEGTNHFFESALERMESTVLNYFSTGEGAEALGLPSGGRGLP